jgi:hypothetical protein
MGMIFARIMKETGKSKNVNWGNNTRIMGMIFACIMKEIGKIIQVATGNPLVYYTSLKQLWLLYTVAVTGRIS